jgi:DNA-binding LacI/PurR family transcriptional regulator
MCSNDVTAIGVLHEAYRAGLRVPDDLSVIGFDDIHMTQMTTPLIDHHPDVLLRVGSSAAVMALKSTM